MAEPGPERPAGPVHWDSSAVKSSECNLARARSMPDGIALAFGATRLQPGGELGMELLHRVHLERVAAERLRELLSKLVSEHEARYRPPA
jgi:hypothetical protein